MTKKILLSACALIFVLTATAIAQNPYVVAYVNTIELINSFPEKSKATDKLIALSNSYKEELQLMQNEYNKKYSDFITYQSSMAENIKLRRMQELTDLENKIHEFMKLAQKDIEEQEKILLEPIKERIKEAVRIVGIEQNFMVIYDLADPAIIFVTPNAVDANPLVKTKLGIR
ncbi:MAG: OmpH family outer membrane protein [Dysgonamonadaceae bacterium]|jgi:outer membrane protein|nr:OmpH family outer membrane protein [Dysgonamonadaceae bacterium]MDD4379025.1 OmpH family outer membrane protein [Dysgonamonadaceae bacterium]